jgi:hypothetical protein
MVLELRGFQRLRAPVYSPPPLHGFAAERQIVRRTGDVNTIPVAAVPTLGHFEENTGALEPEAVKGKIVDA